MACGAASDLTPAQQVALRLAELLLSQPSAIDGALREELLRHYRPEQLLELTLDVMKWSHQKVPVALGTDEQVAPGRLADLAFDDRGEPVR